MVKGSHAGMGENARGLCSEAKRKRGGRVAGVRRREEREGREGRASGHGFFKGVERDTY